MIIAIDGSEANEMVRVGSSEYAYRLLCSLYGILSRKGTTDKFIIFIKQDVLHDLPPETPYWKYELLPSQRFWVFSKLLPRLLKGPKVDVFFSPTHYLPLFISIPQVCVIHDVGYLIFSGQFKRRDFWQLKYWTAISLIVSKYIICVSEKTKEDIVRHYPFTRKKTHVVYHGVDHALYNPNISEILVRRVKEKFNISKNYILSIGTLKPSKNIEGIVDGFSQILNENNRLKHLQLVIAGKKGWLYDSIFESMKKKSLEKYVIFTDYVTTDEKRGLYKGAKALISPSYWEGFGMHVLEAMSCGTPIIISNEGSLPEIAGNCGVYVNAYDPSDIARGIGKVVGMGEKEYNELRYECMKKAKNFTWEKTARETIEVIRRATK